MNPTPQRDQTSPEQPTSERLADQIATNAVKSVLAQGSDGLNVFDELARKQSRSTKDSALSDAVSETRCLIQDLDQRIVRQQRRVEKILFNREGSAEEVQALLDDMIKARAMMRTQLESFEKKGPA